MRPVRKVIQTSSGWAGSLRTANPAIPGVPAPAEPADLEDLRSDPYAATDLEPLTGETRPAALDRCECCGNRYDKAFEVFMAGRRHVFDCFECAIHILAPVCTHCGCRIVGHGSEAFGSYFCCAHCAKEHGNIRIQDRQE
jgi:hypothetical protein